jgi:hypothetical protein
MTAALITAVMIWAAAMAVITLRDMIHAYYATEEDKP